jgi:hypothetical protein
LIFYCGEQHGDFAKAKQTGDVRELQPDNRARTPNFFHSWEAVKYDAANGAVGLT